MMPRPDAFDLLRTTFERVGIRYAVGGSWASTAFGDPRFTNDVDVVVEFGEESLSAFLDALPSEFYVDAEEAVNALSRGRSFNVIHMPSVLKFDLFPSRAFPLGVEELDRALSLEDTGLSKSPARFVTPEDILLAKLHWFRSGREISEVQWRDIQGIVRGCAAGFDRGYLEYGAAKLGVLDLLHRALSEE
ncbi:hypothetical protein [Paludibaculum fermentans]|uniref:hypothetical protein n=1 Tax=Paludibaculum fermentans TaxID=1473598 RepID=UPI003EBF29E0